MIRKTMICITVISGVILSSCTEFLDIKPYGETIPRTAEEFSALLHSHLEKIDLGETTIIGDPSTAMDVECWSDNLEASLTTYPKGNYLDIYVGTKLNKKQDLYEKLYAVIRDCNIILGNISETESTQAKDVVATAYALRGICYYNLLRNFCEPCYNNAGGLGVPVVTEFDMEATPARADMATTVSRIESDLKAAISTGFSDPIYRFNGDIIEGYLTRLYFWTGNYAMAESHAAEFLKKHPVSGIDDFKTMMESMYSYTPGTEMIFKSTILSDNSTGYNGYLSFIEARPVSRRFVGLFAEKEKDVRYALSFNSQRINKKYPFACLRSGEIQLILAESLYHNGKTGDALKALNDLRRNRISGYTDLTEETLPAVNPDDIIKTDATGKPLTPLIYAILCERRKELYMEGDRWYELKRNGRPEFWAAKQGRKYTTMKFMYTFPLPINDVELVEGLIQNPGYDKAQ